MSLDISIDAEKPYALCLGLKGELDSETAPQLESALTDMPNDTAIVVFDMKALEFISSAGLCVVFSTLKSQKARGGHVAIINMSPSVKKVFEIVKALPDMTVFSSPEEMDDYLTHIQKSE